MAAIGNTLGSASRPSVRHPEDLKAKFAAIDADGAVKGANIAATAVDQLVATAADASGTPQSVTCTGTVVGDKVTSVINLTDLTDVSAAFESVITVVDKIQQATTNLATKKILVHLIRGV